MNWKYHTLVILLVLNFATASMAQEAEAEEVLPSCETELVAALLTEPIEYDQVYHLIKNNGYNVNCTFEYNDNLVSPLLFGVVIMHVRLVDFLLLQGGDPNFVQPDRNVTPLARAAWKSANKSHDDPEWKNNFLIANSLIRYAADYEYKFIFEEKIKLTQYDANGMPLLDEKGEPIFKVEIKEIPSSIKRMNGELIKKVLKWQDNDFMGRTPAAKKAIQAQAAKNLKKAEKLRMQKAKKIVF